jgi:hypothetical protein
MPKLTLDRAVSYELLILIEIILFAKMLIQYGCPNKPDELFLFCVTTFAWVMFSEEYETFYSLLNYFVI